MADHVVHVAGQPGLLVAQPGDLVGLLALALRARRGLLGLLEPGLRDRRPVAEAQHEAHQPGDGEQGGPETRHHQEDGRPDAVLQGDQRPRPVGGHEGQGVDEHAAAQDDGERERLPVDGDGHGGISRLQPDGCDGHDEDEQQKRGQQPQQWP